MPQGSLLNVNIPNIPESQLKGIKVTRQAIGRWVEQFDVRTDPYGERYFWLTGEFADEDLGEDTDTWALRNGFVSVCPVTYDLTSHHAMPLINQWMMNLPKHA